MAFIAAVLLLAVVLLAWFGYPVWQVIQWWHEDPRKGMIAAAILVGVVLLALCGPWAWPQRGDR
jgi:uncharacterized membrane protein YphA (DoxX/SURF4 family)